jgi:amino acid transporter
MKRSLTLTGITVNAMALIAPGAFLWTTFQAQSALSKSGTSTAGEMWTGLLFSLILALLTAYSYAELARAYPDAGTGSSYYFAEAAFLDKEQPKHRRYARPAKLTLGWISHLYYWIYPGIMVAFTATLFGYLYAAIFHHTLTYIPLAIVAILFSVVTGYIAYRGISGSTMTAIAINVIQITCLTLVSILFIWFRVAHGHAHPLTAGIQGAAFEQKNAFHVIIPHSFINLVYQSTIAILLLVGFESVTALGAEAIRPEQDIKRGVLLSLLIQGGVCYLFEYFAANFAVGSVLISNSATGSKQVVGGYAAATNSSAPIGDMIKTVGDRYIGNTGQTLAVLVALTVLLALIGTTLACLNTGVRVTYSMAKDKEMPSVLGLLHGRFATPHGGIFILVVVSAVLGIFGANPYQVDNLTQITLASNTGTFLVYGLTCVVTLVAFASRHDKHPVKHFVVPGIGALMNVAELLGVVYIAVTGSGTSPGNAYKALGVVILWCIAGVVWVAINPNKSHAQKVVAARTGPSMSERAAMPPQSPQPAPTVPTVPIEPMAPVATVATVAPAAAVALAPAPEVVDLTAPEPAPAPPPPEPAPMPPVPTTNLALPASLVDRIAAAARDMSLAIEELAAQVLEERFPAPKRFGFIGMGRSGLADIANRFDELRHELALQQLVDERPAGGEA